MQASTWNLILQIVDHPFPAVLLPSYIMKSAQEKDFNVTLFDLISLRPVMPKRRKNEEKEEGELTLPHQGFLRDGRLL